jgi:gamma-glutamylcyclotransferase (GGCT)/AIG2-like uncharacterized protein YtfP
MELVSVPICWGFPPAVTECLFVYGTLRPGSGAPMALRLARESRLIGRATMAGMLYRVGDYPGVVPGPTGCVAGDLLALATPATTLAWLDAYEECALPFPQPWEYRRERLTVAGPDGPACAWVYVYARPTARLRVIPGGDFLAAR